MEQVPRRSRLWTAAAWVWVVLLIGAAATAVAVNAVRQAAGEYAGQLVDRYSDDVVSAITEQADRYGETLTDLAYALGAQSSLSAEDFAHITAGLSAKRFAGATGVAYVVPAAGSQVAATQRYWRAQGSSGLKLVPTPGTDQHEFVVFEKMLTPGLNLQGTDLQGTPPVVTVLRSARESGALALSPAYQLKRDRNLPAASRQTSVVLAAPVSYGLATSGPDAFRGWLVMGLHGQDFLNQPLVERTHGAVQATLTDPTGAGTVIAATTAGTSFHDDTLIRQQSIAVGQRRWHVTLRPTTRLRSAADRGLSRLTLGAGSVLTLMLALLTGILIGSRNRALDQVDRATAALHHDISRRKRVETQLRERERELQHLAFHDPLTGLANRLLFFERVTHAIDGHTDHAFAVLFIDLDGFKPINDTLGHDAGDTVLKETATRVSHAVRAGDTVARLGGDEFAVLIEGLESAGDAGATADHIVAAVQEPLEVAGTTVTVSVSIGIAINQPGADAADILRDADTAMYAAKAGGKNRYVLAEP
jgi:diguanylate cyclase (GGDEF)-like protein